MAEAVNSNDALRSLYNDWIACLDFTEELIANQMEGWLSERIRDQLHILGPKQECVILVREFDEVRIQNVSAETRAKFYNETPDVAVSIVLRNFKISADVRSDVEYLLHITLNEASTDSDVWQTALKAQGLQPEDKH